MVNLRFSNANLKILGVSIDTLDTLLMWPLYVFHNLTDFPNLFQDGLKSVAVVRLMEGLVQPPHPICQPLPQSTKPYT